MHGIVTLLDEINTINVQSLWQKLETECGLSGIKVTPIPHFSWQVAEDYELQSLEPFLRKIAYASACLPGTVQWCLSHW
jgi:hypothetical protein